MITRWLTDRRFLAKGLIITFCFLLLLPSEGSTDQNKGKGKIIAGIVLMGAGAGLAIHGISRFDLLNSNDPGEAEAIAGFAALGAGTVLLIVGFHQKHQGQNLIPVSESTKRANLLWGLSPRKGGFTGGFTLRW